MTTLRKADGFMLIEALVAILIFAMLSSAVAQLANAAFERVNTNVNREAAASLARRELENLRGLPRSGIASRTTSHTVRGIPFAVTVVARPDEPAANMSDITVSVSWSGARNRDATYALRTVFTDLG